MIEKRQTYWWFIRRLKKYLTELERVLLAYELKMAADEDEHAASRAGGLTVYGGDGMLTLLEGEAGELGYNVLRALDFLALEGQHGPILVQVRQRRSVRIER